MVRDSLLMLVAMWSASTAIPWARQAHVQPVLYLPADEPFSAERLELQVQAVHDVQAWYAERVNGSTFFAEPLIVQRSGHSFAELAGDDFQNWWPLPAAEFAGWGMSWNDSSRIKLLILAQGAGAWAGADSENGGILAEAEAGRVTAGHLGGLAVVGDSSLGGILAGACPRDGVASWRRPETGTAWWCNWNTYRGTVAHELGHTFALPHPDAFRAGFRCDSTAITNMQCHWAWPADSLLPFEAAHLQSLPVFGTDAMAFWQPASAGALRGATITDFTRSRTLLWLGGRGGGTGFRWGVELRGGDDASARFVPPAGARVLVMDVGWVRGASGSDTASVRIRSAVTDTTLTIEPGAGPRLVRVPARDSPITIEGGRPGTGTIGLGHPRWEMRER